MKCAKCGKSIVEDERNPAIHYSITSQLCWHCQLIENTKLGQWLQDEKGNYYQKK